MHSEAYFSSQNQPLLNLKEYFESASIPPRTWEMECEGVMYAIESTEVIKTILDSTEIEKRKIACSIVTCELHGIPVIEYLEQAAYTMMHNRHAKSKFLKRK